MIQKQYDPVRRVTRFEISCSWTDCSSRYGFSLSDNGYTDWHITSYLESRGWFQVVTPTGAEVECQEHRDRGEVRIRRNYATDLLKRTLPYVRTYDDDREYEDRIRDEVTRKRIRELWKEPPAPLSVPAVSKDVHTVVNEFVKAASAPTVRKAQGWARGYNWTWYRAMVRYERVA